jgi:hypothetical protein
VKYQTDSARSLMTSLPDVSIVDCDPYEKTDKAKRTAIDLIGGFRKIAKPGDFVAIKPNLVNGSLPETAITTHTCAIQNTEQPAPFLIQLMTKSIFLDNCAPAAKAHPQGPKHNLDGHELE